MKALILSAYCEPEIAASLHLFSSIYEELATSGFEVDLFAPTPTRGVDEDTRKKYKKIPLQILCDGKLLIHRIWMPRENKSTVLRAIRYFYMNIAMLLIALFKKADVIFIASTPPTQGLIGAIVKKIKNVPFVYNVQDVFPDSLANAGLGDENSLLYKVGQKMQNFIYNNADKIIVISEDIKENLLKNGCLEEKIVVIHNWGMSDEAYDIPLEENDFANKFSLNKDIFYAVYAGNIGKAQNINIILYAAKALIDKLNIKFLIVGDGVCRDEKIKLAAELGLSNVEFIPMQPSSSAMQIYSAASVNLIPLKENVIRTALPSKTGICLSCGKPIIICTETDSKYAELIVGEKAGFAVSPTDFEGLAEIILKLANGEVFLDKGDIYKCFLKNFLKSENCKKYVKVIKNVLKAGDLDV